MSSAKGQPFSLSQLSIPRPSLEEDNGLEWAMMAVDWTWRDLVTVHFRTMIS